MAIILEYLKLNNTCIHLLSNIHVSDLFLIIIIIIIIITTIILTAIIIITAIIITIITFTCFQALFMSIELVLRVQLKVHLKVSLFKNLDFKDTRVEAAKCARTSSILVPYTVHIHVHAIMRQLVLVLGWRGVRVQCDNVCQLTELKMTATGTFAHRVRTPPGKPGIP